MGDAARVPDPAASPCESSDAASGSAHGGAAGSAPGSGGEPVRGADVLLSIRPHPATVLIRSLTTILLLAVYAALLMEPVRARSGTAWAVGLLWAAVGTAALRVVVESARWLARRYTLTTSRIVSAEGVLRRFHVQIPLERVQHVVMHRSILERLLGLGTIAASSAGGPGFELVWIGVARPHEVFERISLAREASRERREGPSPTASPPPRRVGRDGTEPAVAAPGRGAGARVRCADGRAGVDRALVIGLAGGIGAGKSEVARILASLGAIASDSDQGVRALLDRPEVRSTLAGWWGERVLDGGGGIDRRAVAGIVFGDGSQRRRLEGLIHPLLHAERAALKARAWSEGARAVVIDAPLLFEAGLEAECDEVWFIDTPRAQRLARLAETRGWDEAELERREAAQLDPEEKRRRSDRIIANEGDRVALERLIAAALAEAERAAAARAGGA